jgi:antitoxin component YwqK of YwqJK toxin-antitoxin module
MLGFMSLVLFGPKPYPKLATQIRKSPVSDGMHTTQYFLAGLLKEEIPYAGGKANGTAYQFYPNGSVLREVPYVDGKVHGTVREYREKRVNARSVSRRYVSQSQHLLAARGELKSETEYFDGNKVE